MKTYYFAGGSWREDDVDGTAGCYKDEPTAKGVTRYYVKFDPLFNTMYKPNESASVAGYKNKRKPAFKPVSKQCFTHYLRFLDHNYDSDYRKAESVYQTGG